MSKESKMDNTNRERALRLVTTRNENHFTQKYVADQVGMTEKNYQKYEYADCWINEESIQPFVEFYKNIGNGYSADYLLCKTTIREPKTKLAIGYDKNYGEAIKHLIKMIELLCDDEFIIHYQYMFPTKEDRKKERERMKAVLEAALKNIEKSGQDNNAYTKRLKERIENEDFDTTIYDHATTIDNFVEFDLHNVCKVKEGDKISEVIITGFSFNKGGVSYGGFSHIFETITTLVKYYFDDFDFNSESVNEIHNLDEETHDILEYSKTIDMTQKDYKEQLMDKTGMLFKKNNKVYHNKQWFLDKRIERDITEIMKEKDKEKE